MIKIQNNTATREALPPFLRGLAQESLLDLSWTDTALGVSDAAWWPEDRQWPDLQPGERYTDEVLTIDRDRQVVVSTRQAEPDPDYVPPEPVYPRFTALEMLDLFTPAEQLAVVQATLGNAEVKLWHDRLIAATFVTYGDPRTEGGLQALVDAGLLTAERKAVIVAAMQPEGVPA